MVPFSAALRLDSQLQKAQGNPINTLTYEWNVSLRSYVSTRILEKNRSNTRSQGLKALFSKWMFTNRSYYKAGNFGKCSLSDKTT